MDACESGNTFRLQQLLYAAGVNQGDSAIDPKYGEPNPKSGPRPTLRMIYTVLAHKQSSIVALLLATYPKVNISREGILEAAFASPHLPTFKLLHLHSPSTVSFEI